MEKKVKVLTIIIFLVILFAAGIFTILGGRKTYSEFEKRKLAAFPKVTKDTVLKGEFQKGLDDFLNDHVVFRDQCVTVSSLANKMIGKKEQNGVYMCKDGYLIEKYEDKDFDKKEIKENVRCLTRFVNMATDSIGNKNVKIALIPSKVNALQSKLPLYASTSKMNEYMKDMLKSKLKNQEVLIDLGDTLKEHSDEYIYYKTDHHWTSLGALYGYQTLMKSMDLEMCTVSSKTDVSTNFRGTTFNKIHYAPQKDIITKYDVDTAKNCELEYDISGDKELRDNIYDESALDTEDKYNYFLGGNYGVIKIHTDCTNGKSLVLIKDSFANCMIPYLTYNFENIVMVDLRYLNSSIFDTLNEMEQIDSVVVLFNEEKFMQDSHLWLLE